MKVFISWSKVRSQAVATALRDWLPDVIQSCDPWMSTEDIEAGQRWSVEIESQLDVSAIGIICVTPENQSEPWLNFEAGAISKKVGTERLARVVPYLLGMKKEDLRLPLGQFQGKIADAEGTFELLQMINRVQDKSLPDAKLRDAFNVWWPKLESVLKEIAGKAHQPAPKRSSDDKIDELLELARAMSRRIDASAGISSMAKPDGMSELLEPSQQEVQRELARQLRIRERERFLVARDPRALEQRILEERILEERARDPRALEQRILEERLLEERARDPRAREQRILEERALEERALEERAREQRILEERARDPRARHQRILEEIAREQRGEPTRTKKPPTSTTWSPGK